jgi:hypothetical protein
VGRIRAVAWLVSMLTACAAAPNGVPPSSDLPPRSAAARPPSPAASPAASAPAAPPPSVEPAPPPAPSVDAAAQPAPWEPAPLPAPEALVAADGTCIDDAAEDDDEPNYNQSSLRSPPPSYVACPGDVDYIQGTGSFSMSVTLRWDPKHGALDVALVDLDDRRYVPSPQPWGTAEHVRLQRGEFNAVGGDWHNFVRVKNRGRKPIAYSVEIRGGWAE